MAVRNKERRPLPKPYTRPYHTTIALHREEDIATAYAERVKAQTGFGFAPNSLQQMMEHDVMRRRIREIKDGDNHYFMLDGQPALFQDIVREFERVRKEESDDE